MALPSVSMRHQPVSCLCKQITPIYSALSRRAMVQDEQCRPEETFTGHVALSISGPV